MIVGSVLKITSGCSTYSKDNYADSIHCRIDKKFDWIDKALIITGLLFLDFNYFERKDNTSTKKQSIILSPNINKNKEIELNSEPKTISK